MLHIVREIASALTYMSALPTKAVFLAQNVVPANDSDAFNHNKCTFCWDPYDDGDHPGVRILPCNHVFGRGCLEEMANVPNGDHCPICRTPLFRPPLKVAFERYLTEAIERFDLFLEHKMLVIYHTLLKKKDAAIQYLPRWFQVIAWLWLHYDSHYWHVVALVNVFTNLYARNPTFDLTFHKYMDALAPMFWWIVRASCPADLGVCELALIYVGLLTLPETMKLVSGQLASHRDRVTWFVIYMLSFVTQTFICLFIQEFLLPGLLHIPSSYEDRQREGGAWEARMYFRLDGVRRLTAAVF